MGKGSWQLRMRKSEVTSNVFWPLLLRWLGGPASHPGKLAMVWPGLETPTLFSHSQPASNLTLEADPWIFERPITTLSTNVKCEEVDPEKGIHKPISP
jgi:hypothetical protein